MRYLDIPSEIVSTDDLQVIAYCFKTLVIFSVILITLASLLLLNRLLTSYFALYRQYRSITLRTQYDVETEQIFT